MQRFTVLVNPQTGSFRAKRGIPPDLHGGKRDSSARGVPRNDDALICFTIFQPSVCLNAMLAC
jgi:hypothetical protein